MPKDMLLGVIGGITEGIAQGMKIREERRFREEELALKKQQIATQEELGMVKNEFQKELLASNLEKMSAQIENLAMRKREVEANISQKKTESITKTAETITKITKERSALLDQKTEAERMLQRANRKGDMGMIEQATQKRDEIDAQIGTLDQTRMSLQGKQLKKVEKLTGVKSFSPQFETAAKDLREMQFKSKDELVQFLDERGDSLSPGEQDELVKRAKTLRNQLGF